MGTYGEPHIAARYRIAVFEFVKILTPKEHIEYIRERAHDESDYVIVFGFLRINAITVPPIATAAITPTNINCCCWFFCLQ